MLEALNLSKQYGDVLALDNLNLNVQPGEIFCLLGVGQSDLLPYCIRTTTGLYDAPPGYELENPALMAGALRCGLGGHLPGAAANSGQHV